MTCSWPRFFPVATSKAQRPAAGHASSRSSQRRRNDLQLRQLLRELQAGQARGIDQQGLSHGEPAVRAAKASLAGGSDLERQPPTAGDLEITAETRVSSEMAALASALNHDPGQLFWWVRNNIDLVPTSGLVQGAGETLASRQGNPVGQAALLIGLLRTSNVAARYVHGEVEISGDDLARWTGSESAESALELLSRNGIATEVVASGGGIGAVRLAHTWVRAWIGYARHRGTVKAGGDRWIDLDPSFKSVAVVRQRDVATEIGVDPVNLLRQIRNQSTVNVEQSWVSQLPEGFITHTIDLWGDDVERYAEANGFTTETLYGKRSVVSEDLQVLPLGLPYPVVSEQGSGPSLSAAFQTAVELSLDDQTGSPLLKHSSSLSELADSRLSLRFDPATPDDQAVLEAYANEPALPLYLVSRDTTAADRWSRGGQWSGDRHGGEPRPGSGAGRPYLRTATKPQPGRRRCLRLTGL